MRAILAAIVIVLLASCSSEQGVNPTLSAVWEKLEPGQEQPAKGSVRGTRLTRAMIDKAGLAMIRARLGEDEPAKRLVATTRHAPYVTYLTRQGQQLTLNGAMITATRGVGHDLLAASSSPGDPLVVNTPPGRWPQTLRRSYRFYGDGPAGRVENFSCRLTPTGKGEITIVEITYPAVRFIEDCKSPLRSFQNVYFADSKGFVWRSRQWISPRLPQIDYDVLEPLSD